MRRFGAGISGRIYYGFGTLLALGVMLTVVALRALSSIDREVDAMGLASDYSTRLQQVSRDFVTMRRTAQRNSFQSADAAATNEAARDAMELLKAAADATISAERRGIYLTLQTELAQFLERRATWAITAKLLESEEAKLFAGDDELNAAAATLLTAVRNSRQSVLPELAAEVVADTTLVRVASWRFLTTQEAGGPTSFNANLTKTQEAIADFEKASVPPDFRGLIEPVKAKLDQYAASFEPVAADLIRINDLHDSELLPRLTEMQTAVDSAETFLDKQFKDARTSAESTIDTANDVQEISSVLALILGGLFAFWVGRSIVRPITRLTSAMERLALGDTDATIPCRDETDEIGAMANAAEVFKQSAIARTRLEAQAIETRSAAVRKAEMSRLANEFEGEVGVIAGTVSSASNDLEDAATNLSMRAETTQRLSTNVVAASEQASAIVLMVSAAADELARSVTEIAHQVRISSRIADDAVQQAQDTNTRIAAQSKAAARISEVIKLITAVAEQTNLLALNATIEAARAGMAGKGFSVVAQEVKALAVQTAKAAAEIGTQISEMQAATDDSVIAIGGIRATINQISEITAALSAVIEEQGASTRDIAKNVTQVAERASEVATDITELNRNASETGAASEQVLTSVKALAGESGSLKDKVDRFLASVRAA